MTVTKSHSSLISIERQQNPEEISIICLAEVNKNIALLSS
jgi:hypothetical protein